MHYKIRHKIPAMAAVLIQAILPGQDTGISRSCNWNIQGANTYHHCLRVKSKVNFICNESKQNGLSAMAANPIICLAKMRITSTVTLPSSTSTMVANTDWECVALPLCEAKPVLRFGFLSSSGSPVNRRLVRGENGSSDPVGNKGSGFEQMGQKVGTVKRGDITAFSI